MFAQKFRSLLAGFYEPRLYLHNRRPSFQSQEDIREENLKFYLICLQNKEAVKKGQAVKLRPTRPTSQDVEVSRRSSGNGSICIPNNNNKCISSVSIYDSHQFAMDRFNLRSIGKTTKSIVTLRLERRWVLWRREHGIEWSVVVGYSANSIPSPRSALKLTNILHLIESFPCISPLSAFRPNLLSLGSILLTVYGIQLMWSQRWPLILLQKCNSSPFTHFESRPSTSAILRGAVLALYMLNGLKTTHRNADWMSRESLLRWVKEATMATGMAPNYFRFHLQNLIKTEWRLIDCWTSLCSAGLKVLPHNAKMHYNFGNFLRDTSQIPLAVHHYHVALE